MIKIPLNIEVKTFLAEELKDKKSSFLKEILFILSAFKFRDFYKEIFLNPKVLFSLSLLKALVSTVIRTRFILKRLRNFLLKENLLNNDLTIYSYWFSHPVYAASLIKKEFPFVKVVTRAHRGDLYKYVSPHNCLKLKYFYGKNLDGIYSISEEGRKHLIEIYGFKNDKIFVSRLGILRHNYLSDFNEENDVLTIVSCSILIPVKRIDKIIEILYTYGKKHSEKRVKWFHIGDGPLMSYLKQKASSILDNLSNVTYKFVGYLPNFEVYEFYKNSKIDLFINTSESEGIPVSIMEAMSFGIPVVASSVGGVPEIVDYETGVLVRANFTIDDMVEALDKGTWFKSRERRVRIKEKLHEKFDAERNYIEFILNALLSKL